MWRGVGGRSDRRDNPMLLDMQQAKRCGARTRNGKPCQSPAMANGRCRTVVHDRDHQKGNWNAFKHGRYTAKAMARRREISALIRVARALESTGCRLDGNLGVDWVALPIASSKI